MTDEGAVKATDICPLPGVSVIPLGALGTVAVSAKTSGAALKRHKAIKQDLRCVTGDRCAKFIGLCAGGQIGWVLK